MTEEGILSLEEEKSLCLEKLRIYIRELTELNRQRKAIWPEYRKWKKRYEEADMALALEDKLTIVKRGRKSDIADSLEIVLQDKEKVKKLVELLREEAEI